EGPAINAAQGSIVFDPAKVEVTSISKSGSIFNLWTQEPTSSNTEGSITFEGGLPNPGYSGTSGLILTISFRTKTATTARGSTLVTLVSGAILANDGLGTNILTSLGKLSITITPNGDNVSGSGEASDIPTSGAPKIESSTHPDSTKWYSNTNPVFSWKLPSSVNGVSYLITTSSNSNPGPKSDGVVSTATFTDIAEGTQYLHVKFREGSTWGPIAHYQFNIDKSKPSDFEIRLVSTTEDIKPQITFEASDALSGIDYYEVQIGDGAWDKVYGDQAGKPYAISFDQVGTKTVSVRAIDKAGNSTTSSIPVTVSGIAVSLSIVTWLERVFNAIVNISSRYGLLIVLLLAMLGILIMIFRGLGATIDKAWHNFEKKKSTRKIEHKADKGFDKLINDMKEEIQFLNAIGKRRHLGAEEKYLKSKLEQYIKSLKNM
ncbi:MAG: hypothetical protein AAB638_01105, partial [Patescibacteria group bacterium]